MKVLLNNTSLFESLRPFNDLGFVPTMGGIHKGHLSLINKSNKLCKKTIVSIFVNPKQFNNKKDLKSYPRNIKKDLKILKKSKKVEFVYIPKFNDIYKDKKKSKIKIPKKDKILCAKFRKGHFEGVLDVMNRLTKIVNPKKIFMGEKDFQQLYLVKKLLVRKYKTKIIPCKTIRDKGNVALSSRNYLLNKLNLKVASNVYKNLLNIKKNNKLNKYSLCPINLGVRILDQVKTLEELKKITFHKIAFPILLLPFLTRGSDIIGKRILFRFEKNTFLLNFNMNILSNLSKKKFPVLAKKAEITFLENRDDFTEKEWEALYKLSENTFVEETESLKKGAAGAGLTDND